MSSWKVEVVADASGRWHSTVERFVTKDAAEAATAWWSELTRIRETRISESDDPATHAMSSQFDIFGRGFGPVPVAP
jgi:hypothetical protein